jgi:hypothetical protein
MITESGVRQFAHRLLIALTCASVVAALATAAVWVRSIRVAEWVGWETLEATPRGGQRHANTAIGTFAGGLMFFRQMNDGPATFTNPVDPQWQWYKEPNPTVSLGDLRLRFSFTHYSLPPKPGEYSLPPQSGKMIGDRGYTLELGVPDWAIIVVFLALPTWQSWRYWRARHRRRRGFDPISASEKEMLEAGGDQPD